jgi:hypothetical protein
MLPKIQMDLRNFEIKNEMKKELNQVQKFKPSCILLMNSHLNLSQAYLFYSFPSQNIYVSGRLLYGALGKV